MDIIFCRNVRMYFTPAQRRNVVGKLKRALVPEGWLALSSTEISASLLSGFRPQNFPGAILHRKSEGTAKAPLAWQPPPAEPATATSPPLELPRRSESARAEPARRSLAEPAPGERIRTLANEGRLKAALDRCDRWVAEEKLFAPAHYLRALVLQELGERDAARQALVHAVYLEPALVVAHFALGNLARETGRRQEATRSFRNALELLEPMPADAPLPEADGLAAGRLREIINSLLIVKTAV
jgi:chemotaxis protein methyltransferase CheR